MKVRIYHSSAHGFRFEPWVPEAPMALVDEYEVLAGVRANEIPFRIPASVLDLIYRDHQAVTGTERNVRLRIRSLSVGDVVQLDSRRFACASVGWTEIDLSVEPRLAEAV